jgi:dipeptidase E
MKLYLSSYQVGNQPDRLASLIGHNKKAAIIMNATDIYGDEKRPQYFKRYAEELSELGLSSTELDLRKFFGKTELLRKELRHFGLIWVVGGNTFTLRRAMHLSGMDQVLPELLRESNLVYGGFSAGGCVLSPTLRGTHLADEPEQVPPGYSPEIIWEGLGLIDFCIAPHYRSNHPESAAIENVIEYYEQNKLPYYALRDGEAIVVNNGTMERIS